ncbi:MAG: hypothetical protein JO218_17600 [Burkholderiales bacterium]|nr:hypothetical protein [Burkholderiales bacterium]
MNYTLTLTRRMFALLITGMVMLFLLLFVFGFALGSHWSVRKEQCVDMVVVPKVTDAKPAMN